MEPFLKIGVTFASFQSGGTIPSSMDLLKIEVRASASLSATIPAVLLRSVWSSCQFWSQILKFFPHISLSKVHSVQNRSQVQIFKFWHISGVFSGEAGLETLVEWICHLFIASHCIAITVFQRAKRGSSLCSLLSKIRQLVSSIV